MEWNKTLAVCRDSEGKTGFVTLSVEDILFLQNIKGQLIAHTENSTFFITNVGTIQKFLDTLRASGYYFVMSDRGDIPNIRKIRKFDKMWSRAYFTMTPGNDSKFVYVARHRFNEFVELTMKYNEHILNNENSRE
jgi:hypothetical protein